MSLEFRPRPPAPPSVLTDYGAVIRRLAELDLRLEELEMAISAARSARAEWTEDHPLTAQGTHPHDAAVTVLRRLLRARQWRIVNEGNQSLALHPTKNIAVTVANGDSATGDVDAPSFRPRTRAAKGEMTKAAVLRNTHQMTFVDFDPLFKVPLRETWTLLFRIGSGGRPVRAELSRPARMDEQGRIDGWAERLILPRTSTIAEFASPPPSPRDWGYPERIDIQVRSKASDTRRVVQPRPTHSRASTPRPDEGGARAGGGSCTANDHAIRARGAGPT